jgi:DNA-directed RNA polymerase specialized sigma24 family protein
MVILELHLAQPATAPAPPDPTLLLRAREYDREALAELCDRNVGRMYAMCSALLGDSESAELLTGRALLKALEAVETFAGDGAAFDLWLLRLAAAEAARHRPQTAGVRADLSRLSNSEYELLALRVLGDVDTDHLSPALAVRAATLRSQLVVALRRLDDSVGAGAGGDLRLFDEAVDRVARGADPQRTAASLSTPPDALGLLRTVAEVRALLRDRLVDAAAVRLRTAFLAAAAERRTQWVRRHQRPATVPGVDSRRYPNKTGAAFALAVAGALALMVGLMLTALSVLANPDSPFYPIKRLGEAALIAVDGDPVSRAQLEVRLAQVREREAEDMAGRGEGDRAVEVMSDRFDLLRDASRDLIASSSRGSKWKDTRDRLFQEASHPTSTVQRDLRVTGQKAAADQIAQLSRNYESDRKQLDPQLGRPAPSPPANQSNG